MNQCSRISGETLQDLRALYSDPTNEENARMHKALSDLVRFGIYKILLREELCVCQIQEITNLPQSTASGAIKSLLSAGLISGRRDGKWIYYHANKQSIEKWLFEVIK